MAITGTTLAAAMDANAQAFTATSGTGATVGGFARIDGEFMLITAVNSATISVAQRGMLGSTAVAHNILAAVTFGLFTDLSATGAAEALPVPFDSFDLVTIGANGAIPVPNRETVYVINKGSALASSAVPDPSKSQDGLKLTFVSGSDFAHVVTFTNAYDGTTGASTTFTMAAFKGASFSVIAIKGQWLTLSNCLTTIT